ncbi:MAG: hypothetical protein HY298_02325 [Verrucomicrobia bacterium]|nr:hypothetical protein [Verrucomicrobiota bacterium]
MKRSRSIRLVLIGGLSAGALTSCGPENPSQVPVSPDRVYTNNFYVRGVGYYHAPFRAWYQIPYNYYEPKSQRYFYGGQWGESPHQSITNISSPTPETAQQAQAQRTDVPRGGFGSSSRSYHTWS